MYKDKEKQKEAVKRAVDKHRGITKGITSEGITGQGITRIEFIQKELNDPYLVQGIEVACKTKWQVPGDIRYERAYIYKLKREGHKLGSIIGKSLDELRDMT